MFSLTISEKDNHDIDHGYGSALVGASYRVSDLVEPYVTIGVGRGAMKVDGDIQGHKFTV
ncbi:hypothetical protein [Citrobacter portucalensis]|uniref:hypothetical protein n=1 Tax=Citrobacter portucalensis TaxID=1639133 RepID=UPI00226B03DF|nr:hypothetical protein [Citrobacter portucalensis]MCX8986037.1 hypothetical protein [Citrobacter portucalensis]